MKRITATAKHQAAKESIVEALRKHEKDVSASEMLAIMSQMVGMVIAMQDHTTTTPEQAMQTVMHNITAGNAAALVDIMTPSQGKAN